MLCNRNMAVRMDRARVPRRDGGNRCKGHMRALRGENRRRGGQGRAGKGREACGEGAQRGGGGRRGRGEGGGEG